MDDDAIIGVSLMAGALLGIVVGSAVFGVGSTWAVVATISCAALGISAGHRIVGIRKSRRKRRPASQPKPSPFANRPPKAFRSRLAEYTGQDETEVMNARQSHKSRMPFWIAIEVLARVPPRSARLIRRYLLSIRKAVRGRTGDDR